MPNILSSQGLDINNITQVGVAGLLQSNFLISPAEGYFIAESQFSIDEDYLAEILENNAEITNITFSNTTIGFASDNKVNVNITWAANTTLTDDIDFNLAIRFDDVNQVYDTNSTFVTLPLNRGGGYEGSESIWSNVIVDILPIPSYVEGVAQVSNLNIVSNNTYPNQDQGLITFAATEDGPLMVCDIQFKASDVEGMRAFINAMTIIGFDEPYVPGTGGQLMFNFNHSPADSENGEFTWTLIETINDQFDNPYSYKYRLSYTRNSEGPIEAIFDNFNYFCFSNSNPYSITNAGSSGIVVAGVGAGDALDGAGTLTSEASKSLIINNIPSENVTFTFSSTWAQLGDEIAFYLGGNEYAYHFDVDAIDVGLSDRTLTVDVRDDKYPLISRTTFTILQQTEPYVLLKIATENTDAIEMYYDNYVDTGYDSNFSNNENIFTSTGIVISHVSPVSTNWLHIPSADGPLPQFAYATDGTNLAEAQGITHYVYAFTNTNVSLAQMQEVPLIIAQDQYPVGSSQPRGWVIPQYTGWDQVGGNSSGVFRHAIAIRNQDEEDHLGNSLVNVLPIDGGNQARTATLSIAHPQDGSISSSATITQDNTWDNGDSLTLNLDGATTPYSNVAAGHFTEDVASVPSGVGDTSSFRLFVRQTSPSSLTNFNMRTLISNDKQYPPPRVTVLSSGSYTTYNGVDVFQASNGTPGGWVNGSAEIEGLTLNPNYDSADVENNYQYYFDYTATANTGFEERFLQFSVFHPQRTNFTDVSNLFLQYQPQYGGIIKHIQPEPNLAILTPQAGVDTGQLYLNWGEGAQSTNVVAQWTGSAPTIGIWDPLTEQYFALAAGVTTTTGFSYQQVSTSETSYLLTCSFPENTPDNEREITLGIWHSSSDPNTDFPKDTMTITQYAQPFDPALFWVLNHTLAGFDSQTSEAGSATIYFQVSDYDAEDFANGTNNPTIQIRRWNLAAVEAGEYVDSSGNYDDEGILPSYVDMLESLTPNPSWNILDAALGIQYTHSLVVNYSAYTGSAPYVVAVKAKHFYADDYAAENHSFFTIEPPAAETEMTAVWVDNGDGVWQYHSNESSVNLPSSTKRIKFRVNHTPFGPYVDLYGVDFIHPSDLSAWGSWDSTNYTYARFLNAAASEGAVTHVFAEDSGSEYDGISQANIPLMFATGPNAENSTHVIDKPYQIGTEGFTDNNNVNNNSNNATVVSATLNTSGDYTSKLNVILNVRPNETGSPITARIGVWNGKTAPRTNLINTNGSFNSGGVYGPYTLTSCQSNYFDPTCQGQFTNIFNPRSFHHVYDNADTTGYPYTINADFEFEVISDLLNKLVYKPIQSSEYSGTNVYDGFTWNIDTLSPYPTFSNSLCEVAIRFQIFEPVVGGVPVLSYSDGLFNFSSSQSSGEGRVYGRNKLLGVSFEVEDFEKADPSLSDTDVRCGFLHGSNQHNAWEHPNVQNAQAPFQNNYVSGVGDTWSVPQNIIDFSDEYDVGFYLNELYEDALTFHANGKYEGIIKQGAMNNSACLSFFAKAGARFTIKNIKVWEIADDIRIRPNGQAVALPALPTDQKLFTLAPLNQLIKFATTGYIGSPINGNPNANYDSATWDGLDWVIAANSDQAYLNGTTNQYLFDIENTNNYATANILVWDGTNSSSLDTIDWITNFTDYQAGGNYLAFSLTLLDNFTEATRSVTLGIWAGNPASDTTAPEDTFTISQLATSNPM